MQKILLLIFLCPAFLTYAQNSNRISIEDPAYSDFFLDSTHIPQVKGKIINCPPELYKNMTISYECIPPYPYSTSYRYVPVSEDGTFQLDIREAVPFQQIFLHLKDYMYCQLFVAKDVCLTIDISQIPQSGPYKGQGLHFSGSDGEMCQFIHQYFRDCNWPNYEREKAVKDKIKAGNYNLSEICKFYDDLEKEQQQADQLYLEQHPSAYGWILENRREAKYWQNILESHMNFSPFTPMALLPVYEKELKNYKGYVICHDCNNYYAYLSYYYQNMISNQYRKTFYTNLLHTPGISSEDKQLLKRGIKILTHMEQHQPYDSTEWYESWQTVRSSFSQELSVMETQKCMVRLDSLFSPSKADAIKMYCLLGDDETRLKLAQLLEKNVTTPWCLKKLTGLQQDITRKLQKEEQQLTSIRPLQTSLKGAQAVGETNFGAHLYKIDKANSRKLIPRLQSNFPRHALVIDLWSTWCQFCPASLNICHNYSKQLKNESVQFISLCSSNSSNEKNWKAMILKLRIPGIHIYVEDKIAKELRSQYQLSEGFPCIFAFDREGNYLPEATPQNLVPDFEVLKKYITQ